MPIRSEGEKRADDEYMGAWEVGEISSRIVAGFGYETGFLMSDPKSGLLELRVCTGNAAAPTPVRMMPGNCGDAGGGRWPPG